MATGLRQSLRPAQGASRLPPGDGHRGASYGAKRRNIRRFIWALGKTGTVAGQHAARGGDELLERVLFNRSFTCLLLSAAVLMGATRGKGLVYVTSGAAIASCVFYVAPPKYGWKPARPLLPWNSLLISARPWQVRRDAVQGSMFSPSLIPCGGGRPNLPGEQAA